MSYIVISYQTETRLYLTKVKRHFKSKLPFFSVNQVLFNFASLNRYVITTFLDSSYNDLSMLLVIFFSVSNIILLTIILFKGPSGVKGSPPKIKPPAEKPRPKPGSGNTPPPPKGLQVPRV